MTFPKLANIENNTKLRLPQREGWAAIKRHFEQPGAASEIGVVLPVGCGKSGLIAITPFAVAAQRVLVVAPGTRIRKQLADDLKASSDTNFYARFDVFDSEESLPTAALIASGKVNLNDFQNSDFAVANIHQIAGEDNRWLGQLPADFFDLILVDEAHHNTAESWQQVKQRFPNARVVNYSATPLRADGRIMAGEIVYSFPVSRAIQAGYVKRLRAKMLRPASLRYVDPDTGVERTIGPEEVQKLGETDSKFRRGIVVSTETLGSMVTCALRELQRLRKETGEPRLKIIASGINQNHCIQIKEEFCARGLRCEYVHSNEGKANDGVLEKLESHQLDAIVQARMLGEGFDHPYLAVAMVGNIYSNLSPFVQFVGRVMRAIKQNAPGDPLNQGVVIFHAGANIAKRWSDFRKFSEADQEYFADLLPEVEDADFDENEEIDWEPGTGTGPIVPINVLEELGVVAADMEPIGDARLLELLRELAAQGVTPEQAATAIRRFQKDPQDVREARRKSLADREQNEAGGILKRLEINPQGKTLDKSRRQKNFPWITAQLKRRVAESVGGSIGDRQNFSPEQLEAAHVALPGLVASLEKELRDGL